jgi:formylmethanofuran dehydrogenase subunit D
MIASTFTEITAKIKNESICRILQITTSELDNGTILLNDKIGYMYIDKYANNYIDCLSINSAIINDGENEPIYISFGDLNTDIILSILDQLENEKYTIEQ